jgi:hypothetical protein
MTTNTQAKVICDKAKHTQGIITPTEVMMLVDFVERALPWCRTDEPVTPEQPDLPMFHD